MNGVNSWEFKNRATKVGQTYSINPQDNGFVSQCMRSISQQDMDVSEAQTQILGDTLLSLIKNAYKHERS